MHIPENYLSPTTCAVAAVAMVPIWAHAVKQVKNNISKEKMPLLGAAAAFSFVAMMFNVPIAGGSTGHAVGGTLIAILLGPDAACLSVSIALILQALLFGDGGILAIGANCFNMAFVMPYLGYAVYKLLKNKLKGENGKYVAAAVGAYVGINAAALCTAIEFGIQPALFHDAAGLALYCPYGLNISVPAMMAEHLTLFGLVEVLFTVAVYAFVSKTTPAIIEENTEKESYTPFYALLAVLIALVPIGLLAEGTAWGEWGADEIAEVVEHGAALGYTPQGMVNGFEFEAIMPDYSIAGMSDAIGYILCAIIGVGLCILIFRVVAASIKKKVDFAK